MQNWQKWEIFHNGIKKNIYIYGKQEAISGQILTNGTFFEAQFLEFLRLHFPNQRSIIDIGANIGNHSLFFSEFMTYDTIYCFEPNQDNVEILRLNMMGKCCVIHDIALSNVNGEQTLYNSDNGNSGAFSLEKFEYYQIKSYEVQKKIETKTLDSFNLENISMIKIDVEGHELKVLEGAIETILKNKPVIMIEDLHYAFPSYFPPGKFNAFFEKINYFKSFSNVGGFYIDIWESKI